MTESQLERKLAKAESEIKSLNKKIAILESTVNGPNVLVGKQGADEITKALNMFAKLIATIAEYLCCLHIRLSALEKNKRA